MYDIAGMMDGMRNTYKNSRTNTLAKLAFTQPERRQEAIGEMYGINPSAANQLDSQFTERDKANLAEFSRIALNAPENQRQAIYDKGKQVFGAKLQSLGATVPDTFEEAAPFLQQFAGISDGGFTGAPVVVDTENGPMYARYSPSGMTLTEFKAPESFKPIIDPVTGQVSGYGNRTNTLRATGTGSPQAQPTPQGQDPMQPYLDQIRQGQEAMRAQGKPIAEINAWAEQKFAEAQYALQSNGVQFQGQQDGQARVSVKPEKVDVLGNTLKELQVKEAEQKLANNGLTPKQVADIAVKRRKEVNLVNSNATKVNETVKLIDQILNSDALGGVTGLGRPLSYVPGSKWADVDAKLQTLKARSAFGSLSEMRASSPTGGALGNVSERELDLLQNAETQLATAQSPEAFAEGLRNYKRILLEGQKRMVDGLNEFYSQQGQQQQTGSPEPNAPVVWVRDANGKLVRKQ